MENLQATGKEDQNQADFGCCVHVQACKYPEGYRKNEDICDDCEDCCRDGERSSIDAPLNHQARVPIGGDWSGLKQDNEEYCYHETEIECVEYLVTRIISH